MQKETVIIVGAGISGLVAARNLAERYHVIVLEATERWGGRIYSLPDNDFPGIIEGGAEFIHGKAIRTLRLIKEAGIALVPVKGRMYRKEKGKLIEQEEMVEGWGKLLDRMKRVKDDMIMYDFLQQYYGDNEYTDLRRQAIAFTEGFDVADVKKVTVSSLYKEWKKQEGHSRISGGYGALVSYLATACESLGCTILTGEPVTQVDWEAGSVTVYTSTGKKFEAEKVIISAPLPVLQKALSIASINFTPPLDEYVSASQKIGFGKAIKVSLLFTQQFWKEDCGFILSDESFPTWWVPFPESAVLTGWAGGSKAQQLSADSNDALSDKALLSLANIFDRPLTDIRGRLIATRVFNWQKNEWALGAYSFAMPGTTAARKLLNTPVEQTVYFTGEGLYDGPSPGTVEAAIVQAEITVKNLLHEKKIAI